jgi:hypothetical protein
MSVLSILSVEYKHLASWPTLESNMATQQVSKIEELIQQVAELQARIEKLEATNVAKSNKSDREMTDDDARRILSGDLATMKHKEVAEKLGLSYGQVYSCRLEFTFKHIHKEMRDANVVNPWKK